MSQWRTSSFDDHLDHSVVVFKDVQHSFSWEEMTFEETKSTFDNPRCLLELACYTMSSLASLMLLQYDGMCYQWKQKGQCSQGYRCSFRHETQDTLSEPTASRGRNVSRKRSIRGKSNHGPFFDNGANIFLKGTCTRTSCEYWHPPESQFLKKKKRNGLYDWRQVSVSALQG